VLFLVAVLEPDFHSRDPLAGYYLCAQGRYIRLHTNWKHHKLGLLKILDLPEDATREQVAARLLQWDAERFEDEARKAGMCATMCRSAEEWKATQAAQSVQSWLDENSGCPVKVTRVPTTSTSQSSAVKSPQPFLRVIDMSRVIAAPVAGRALASESHSTQDSVEYIS
jgi:crotonobetainyl-CoA:carnitine CoA-transferase CaiB-like acyl-CoA transferase